MYILQIFLIMAKVMGWTSASWFIIFTPLWLAIVIFGFVYWIGGRVDKEDK